MSNLQNSISGLYEISYKLTNKFKNLSGQIADQIKKQDYTAFEVFPTSVDIPAGTLYSDEIIPSGLRANVPAAYLSATTFDSIPSGDTFGMQFRSYDALEDSDIVIDWGDNTPLSTVSETGTQSGSFIKIQHKYDILDQAYIVKIFGKKYYQIGYLYVNDSTYPDLANPGCKKNLISRVLNEGLPIASNLTCLNEPFLTQRLFSVSISQYDINVERLKHIIHCAMLFAGCKNLLSVTGFSAVKDFGLSTKQTSSGYSENKFNQCYNLYKCDMRISNVPYNVGIYSYCVKLTGQATDLFSVDKYTCKTMDITSLFARSWNTNHTLRYNTFSNLTCDTAKLAKILWENSDVTWTATKAFQGLKAVYRKNIPTSFGGCSTLTTINGQVETTSDLPKAQNKVYKVTEDGKYYSWQTDGPMEFTDWTECEATASFTEVATLADLPEKTYELAEKVYKVTADGKYYKYSLVWEDVTDFIVTQECIDSSAAIQAKIDAGYYKQSSDGVLDDKFTELKTLIDELNENI